MQTSTVTLISAALPRHFDDADDDIAAVDLRDAEEEVLADVETLTNWLCGECAHAAPQRLGYVPLRCKDELAARVERACVPELVALRNYPNAVVCYAATQELQKRYLGAKQAFVLAAVAEARA
jgi:hypothetical protein